MDVGAGYSQDLCSILLSSEQVQARVAELGAQITQDYQGKSPVLIGVLKGVVVFFADLFRHIDLPVEIDFMAISSYGSGTSSTGKISIIKDASIRLAGRDVIIVEDIVDSGLTLTALKKMFEQRMPASLRVVTLLDKPSRRRVEMVPDYCGFEIEDHFVVGYGLDYNERYRNLPCIGVLKPEIYNN